MAPLPRSAISAVFAFERLSLSSCTTKRTFATTSSIASSSSSTTPSNSPRDHHYHYNQHQQAYGIAKRLNGASRAEISARTGGAGRTVATRSFSTTTSSRASFLSSIRNRLSKVVLGSNYTDAQARGGVLPEEQRRQELARRRDAALASVSPDGEALFDDPTSLPVLQSEERAKQRLSSKIAARQQRKRWNATDASGNVLEHKYSTALFKISPRKLKLLADQIGGKPIDHAILQMQFSPKRASKRILSTLALARDHAQAKGMDVKRLIVSEAWISKGRYLVRADFKGRCRMGRKHHPEAKMSVVLRYGKTQMQKELERLEKVRKTVRSIGTAGVTRTDRKVVNAWQRPAWQW